MRSYIKHLFFLLFFGTLFLSACGDGQYKTLYHQTIAFPDHQWKNTYKPTFSFTIADTTQVHLLKMVLRTTSSFPYANLWLEVPITDPSGKWLGEKSGSVVNISKIIVNDNFPKPGKYTVVFEQVSLPLVIPELLDITLDLFETKGGK
jgi:hypothetical protein